MLAATAGSLAAAAIALGFPRRGLGPDEDGTGRGGVVRDVAGGLLAGARATARTPAVAAPFLGLVAHRLAFGVNTLLMLMLFRSVFAGDGIADGLVGVGQVVALTAAGLGVAALVTPPLVRRLGSSTTVRAALAGAAAAQFVVATLLTLPAVLVTAFALGVCGQVVKLCADAGVQAGADDAVRGRVFALFDAVFNVCYVLAVTAAALLAPPDGASPALLAGAGGLYLLGLAVHVVHGRVHGGAHGRFTRPCQTDV